MVDALVQVSAEARRTNEYFNSGHLIEASRRELDRAIADGDIVEQLESYKTVGVYELNIGNSVAAAEHLSKACDLIPVVIGRRLAAISESSKESLYLKAGIAYLRMAEDQNCVHCADGSACILPIASEAIHKNREGSENAIVFFKKALEVNPRSASSAWLLNIAAMTLGEYPQSVPQEYRIAESRLASENEFPRFHNISADLGLDTFSHAGGAIADDFDGDHLLDIVVSNWDPDGPLRYFRNQGDGTFRDETERANLEGITGGLNIIHADYDNDGDLDLYVLRGAWLSADVGRYPNSLLRNDGQARFTDVTFAVGLGETHHPTQTAAWADFDNDGDVDLYVGNEKTRSQLFRNDSGRFVDVADELGMTNPLGFAKAVSWGDFNGDGWPDLYVSNLGHGNLLFQNNRDGTFADVTHRLGVSAPADSFASWFWDYNNDGHLDLFVGSYSIGVQFVGLDYLGVGRMTEGDHLYENTGAGRFQEVGFRRGLTAVTQPMGCNFGDLDNDGYLDFYLGTGYPGYDGLMPNVMYRNRAGKTFEDVTFAGGFGHLQKGHGVAFADFDHDGDQDVFTELGGAYRGDAFHDALFENPGFDNNWIKIRLVGTRSNRSAIGARISLAVSEPGSSARSIYRWVTSGSSFGGNPFRQEIGVGRAERIDRIEVRWPASDETQVFENVDVNQFLEITESVSEPRVIPITRVEFDADGDRVSS